MISKQARIYFRLALLAFLITSSFLSPTSPGSAADTPGPAAPGGANVFVIPPLLSGSPKVDGFCDEYPGLGAAVQTFSDGNGVTSKIYFIYSADLLYVCMQGSLGSFRDRFGRLYIDPQADGSGYVYANQGDLGFQVNIPGTTRSSYRGNGSPNGWTVDATLDGKWQGVSSTGAVAPTGDSVEYALQFNALNFGINCSLFGMAIYHHWFASVGNDYGWPSNQYFDQPRTWQIAQLGGPRCEPASGRIAYVFRGNTLDASSFFNLLTSHSYTVDLVPLTSILTTDFSVYKLILVADDTGSLDQWGLTGFTDAEVSAITKPNIPIIGIGEGGYAFFGRLSMFIGWPQGWHGPQKQVSRSAGAPVDYFTGIVGDPITHYGSPVNSVGIYTKPAVPPGVTLIGDEVPSDDHTQIIQQGCRLLWGASGNPLLMTADGQRMFLNAVGYMYVVQCPSPTPPPQACYLVQKTANPPNGTPAQPGDVIEYTITYQIISNVDCKPESGIQLADTIPLDTTFVPGSASDGISPGGDGSLVWPVSSSAGPLTKSFKVVVSENQCQDQHAVKNRAGLLIPGYLPLPSNVVSHPVTCSPVGFPNHNPSYAQDEIQVNPYPLILGHPSSISVRISNFTGTARPITVDFQTSPQKFGIGLSFNTFDTRSTVVPANGQVIVVGTYTPAASGYYCIQIVVNIQGQANPLVTQQNIDVTEDLQAGVLNTLSFQVGNPTSSLANIALVVDNTCPGWTAVVTPTLMTAVGPNDSDIRPATLKVTPPNPLVLNGGCHIDVQGWIGDLMIGGIRKLDVPPVHLPTNVQPPWEEPEIVFQPDPPIPGVPGKICIVLQNPLVVARTVTVKFEVADFGAGIPFTAVGTQNFTLPPNSLGKYCIPWTPATGGTLHRCALITLSQAGAQDQHSQRNVDLVQPGLGRLDLLAPIHFIVGNHDLITHTLELTSTMVGIDPYWTIHILPDPPPDLGPGQQLDFMLSFMPMLQAKTSPQAPPSNFRIGDVSEVEVKAMLDGQSAGGITVQLDSLHMYMPIMSRNP
jgi:uncharacterized repeat protein (TIGR01451 family)